MATKGTGDIGYAPPGKLRPSAAESLINQPFTQAVEEIFSPAAVQPEDSAPEKAESADLPCRGVLVVGTGDEARGDESIGLHLLGCLQQLHWPGDVVFVPAGPEVARLAEQFACVVVLESVIGPDGPGALYQARPGDLTQANLLGKSLGMLGQLSPSVCMRTTVLGLHPKTSEFGSQPSTLVLNSFQVVLPFVRSHILGRIRDVTERH